MVKEYQQWHHIDCSLQCNTTQPIQVLKWGPARSLGSEKWMVLTHQIIACVTAPTPQTNTISIPTTQVTRSKHFLRQTSRIFTNLNAIANSSYNMEKRKNHVAQ
ncbi:hypothetical protein V8G54_005881 [Vigna mungo]|uniref:Uncharacterized protein n=1 Tax=Vigna mungo TaxID=3915 RepID=A0AAQ3S7I2_VIGMU